MLNTMFNVPKISGNKKILRGVFLLAIGFALIAWLPKPAMADEIVWEYSTGLSFPTDADRLANGNTLIADDNNGRVIEVTPDGTIVWEYIGVDCPWDVRRLSNGNTLIADADNQRVIEVTPYGTIVWEYISGINVVSAERLSNGNTLIAGSSSNSVIEVTPDGSIVWEYSTGLSYPYYAERLSNGNTLITDMYNSRVIEVTPDGSIVWEYSTGLSYPASAQRLAIGNTLIADGGNNRVIEVGTAAIIGDFNSDGYVDAADLQLLGDHWHFVSTDPGWDALYDLVPDGIIDAADLQVFGDHWHEGTPPKSDEGGKGPNEFAGIVFDLDRTTYGNQNLTSIPSQPTGTYIPVDVYCTGVNNLDTYEFEVIYNPEELEYISSSATNPITYEGNILESLGGTALGWMVDDSTPGVLSIAYTLAGNDPAQAPEGEGLIADIVFQALVATHGTLSFGDVYYYDSYGVVDLITDTGTATLPVELSSFNAIYNTVSGFVSLCWATSSETDVNGFNIYRNTEDSFVEADKINIDLIAGSGTTTEPTEYSFTDETADPYYTTYYYWLEVINFSGINDEFGPYKYIPIDVNNNGELDIITSILSPCYPNPARIGNEIKFSFRVGGLEGTARNVELKVYNILGKLVAEVVNGERLVNDYTETWNPDDLTNGVYFYQLNTENYSEVKKMVIQ